MRMNPKPTRLTRLTLKPKPPQCRLVVEWREQMEGARKTPESTRGSGTRADSGAPGEVRDVYTQPRAICRPLVLFEQAVVFGAACVNGGAARGRAASRRLPGQPLDYRAKSPERSAATGLASQQQCIASWRAMRSRHPPRRCPTVAGPRRKAPALCWTRSWQPPRRIRAVAALRSTATRAASALRVPKPGCPPTLLRERRASSGAPTLRS